MTAPPDGVPTRLVGRLISTAGQAQAGATLTGVAFGCAQSQQDYGGAGLPEEDLRRRWWTEAEGRREAGPQASVIFGLFGS